ncbi:hypothetical protein [Actinoplanes sp. URMC 104]|uniref:hypothetical protein n=1 Tax=Actinoplanes sp. URMC 104 TaxID=3423409 RepID=UPI003F1DB6CA
MSAQDRLVVRKVPAVAALLPERLRNVPRTIMHKSATARLLAPTAESSLPTLPDRHADLNQLVIRAAAPLPPGLNEPAVRALTLPAALNAAAILPAGLDHSVVPARAPLTAAASNNPVVPAQAPLNALVVPGPASLVAGLISPAVPTTATATASEPTSGCVPSASRMRQNSTAPPGIRPGGTVTGSGPFPATPSPAPLHPGDHFAGAGHVRDSGGGSGPPAGTVPPGWWPRFAAALLPVPADASTSGRTVRYCGPPS